MFGLKATEVTAFLCPRKVRSRVCGGCGQQSGCAAARFCSGGRDSAAAGVTHGVAVLGSHINRPAPAAPRFQLGRPGSCRWSLRLLVTWSTTYLAAIVPGSAPFNWI